MVFCNSFIIPFRFRWRRTSTLLGHSEIDIQWEIPADQKPGTYMIKYYGNAKEALSKKIDPFTGATKSFIVEAGSYKESKDLHKLWKWNSFLDKLNKNKKAKNTYNF